MFWEKNLRKIDEDLFLLKTCRTKISFLKRYKICTLLRQVASFRQLLALAAQGGKWHCIENEVIHCFSKARRQKAGVRILSGLSHGRCILSYVSIRRVSSPQTWLCGLGTTAWKPLPANILLGKFENLDEILIILKSVRSFGTDINKAKIPFILQLFCVHKVQGMYFLLWLHMKAGLESYVCIWIYTDKKVYSFC